VLKALSRTAFTGLIVACLSFHANAASRSTVRVTVPIEYRGEWTNQLRYCGTEGDNLDSVLTVTGSSVGYYENTWRVRRVEVTPSGLRLTYWPRTDFDIYAPNQLRLSRDGLRIFTSDDRADQGARRCPKRGR
jgi:hypothetical protein